MCCSVLSFVELGVFLFIHELLRHEVIVALSVRIGIAIPQQLGLLDVYHGIQVHQVVVADVQKEHANQLVVGLGLVLQVLNVVENIPEVLDVLDVFVTPEEFTWVFQAFVFYFGDIIFVVNMTPGQTVREKVQYNEVKAPQIIPARQVFLQMRIQTCICNGSSKIRMHPFLDRHVVLQVFLGQAKVYYENSAALISLPDNEVGWFNVSVYEAARMHIVNGVEHLDQKCYY